MTDDGFDTTPKPAFLRAMQNQKWTAAGALAELIDNSFGAGRGNADQVHIIHDVHKRVISVLDNGRGMEAVGRLFQLGNTIGHTPGDIGLYGSGGTMAILWLPRRVQVWTLRDGQISHDTVTWADEIKAERFPIISNTWKRATATSTPTDLYNAGHGSLIVLELLRERHIIASNVRRDLARLYSPALRSGKKIFWTTSGKNGGTDQLVDPFVFPDDPIQFNLTVSLEERDLLVTGQIGIVPDLPQEQSRISIGFGSRVIQTTRDCFASQDGTERYSGVGVTGWLDLVDGWQPYLSTTKDGINDDRVWNLLMEHVFQKIKDILAQVDKQKLSVILEDLRLNLEPIFDKGAHQDMPAAENSDDQPQPDPGPCGPKQEPLPDMPEPPEPAPGDDTIKPQPVQTKIRIVPLSDTEMEGILCNAEISDRDISAFINVDHEVVKTAMISKPVNRQMLNFMVISSISAALSDSPDMTRKIFPPRAVKQIEERQEPRRREGLITRMLIDRIAA